MTAEVERWLRLFEVTHEIVGRDGRVEVRRVGFPEVGGLAEQDAKDLEALDLLRREWQQAAQAQVAQHVARRRLQTWRDDRAARIERGDL